MSMGGGTEYNILQKSMEISVITQFKLYPACPDHRCVHAPIELYSASPRHKLEAHMFKLVVSKHTL